MISILLITFCYDLGVMDIKSLKTFLMIAQEQSFSRAAEQLHLSQPAISKRIAQLEQDMNMSLFNRIGRHVSLTEAGTTLLPHAKQILRAAEQAERSLSQLSETVSGSLRIATSHHVGLHHLPKPLRAFVSAYPQVELDIAFLDSEVACQAVESGDIELAVVTLPLDPPDSLICECLWDDPLGILVADNHALANTSNIQLKDLMRYPAVLPDAQTYTRRLLDETFTALDIQPQVLIATNYLETLRMLVSTGLGWSALPVSLLDGDLRCLEIEEFSASRQLGIVQHARRQLSRSAETFRTDIRSSIQAD